MKVALAGFGTVGQAVARILLDQPSGLALTHIFNRGVARKRVPWVPASVHWTDNFDDIVHSDADVVVEVVGGVDPAGTWVRRSLDAGKSVVTANKQLLAHHADELLTLARARQRHLAFEASVAGGIPVIRALRDGLAGDWLYRVSGIWNGTCNYVLTRMEEAGLTFGDALAEAQNRGFAEADPTDDVDGFDARAKLCILGRVGLQVDVRPADVGCRSIRPVSDIDFLYARRLGCTIRQVSRVEIGEDGTSVVAFVQPALVPTTSPLARVQGSQNLVVVSGRYGGETAFSGFGAGGGPTAVAVVSDFVAIAETGPPSATLRMTNVVTPGEVTDRHAAPSYVRLVVADWPGIIAALASAFAAHHINIDAVLQEPGTSKDALPFVITLEESDPRALTAALTEIGELDFHVEPPLAMPILTDHVPTR